MMDALDVLCGLIKQFEGCRLKSYLCPAGVPTIGWGSTGPDVKLGITWTQEQADRRMRLDAQRFLVGTQALCPSLQGEALGAVADFAYNCGLTRLKASTLRKKLNAGDFAGAKRELMKWTRGGGRVLPGLVARRKVEAAYL